MEKKRLPVLTAVQICGKHVAGELSSDKNQTVCDCRSKSISPGKPSREKKMGHKILKHNRFHCTQFTFNCFTPSVSHLVAGHGTEQTALCSVARKKSAEPYGK